MNQDKLQHFLSQKIVTIPLFIFQNMDKFSITAEEFKFVSDMMSFMNSEFSIILIPVITLILYGISCLVSIRFYEGRAL